MKTLTANTGLLALLVAAPLAVLAADKAPATPAAAKPKKIEIECESTSSRIRRNKADDCAKATQPTTNYYRRDLERSGQLDTSKALRDIDPRFQ